jgi:hypothetical protein
MRHQHRRDHRRHEHAAFSAPVAFLGAVGLFTSIACSTDSSSATYKDGGASNGGKATGGANNGGTANEGSGGTPANGGTVSGTSGGANSGGNSNAASGGASNGGTANGGTNAGGTANGGASAGGTANGGRAGSGGANSTGSGGASNGGASNGGASDSGAPMLIDQYVTFYGWPDNDPPGNGIAYPGLHKAAGGTGTYADPITFATDPTEWKPGTILYLPYLKRYVIMEDSCAECITDWKTRKYHIDIWLESNGSFDSQVLACENTLTRAKTSVEIDPPPDRPVDATPLSTRIQENVTRHRDWCVSIKPT